MKIDLPLETWVELFGFLPRLQLAQLVTSPKPGRRPEKKFRRTIKNRQFVSFVQFYLHKCGEITLGELDIKTLTRSDQPFPDVPMPNNIKSFKEITIRRKSGHPSALDFLQKFQQNSLFTNVNLIFVRVEADALPGLLANLFPLIDSVNSITFCDFFILRLIQVQYRSHGQVKMMLASARILQAWYNYHDDWLCQWVYTPRQDGKPRVLVLHVKQIDHHQFIIRFVERVKKEFMHSNGAISFFIHISRPIVEIQSISLDNWETSEKMVVNGDAADTVTISRYPVGAPLEWIKEMGKCSDWETRQIVIAI